MTLAIPRRAVLALPAALALPAHAQTLPRPARVVIGFPPGGSSDVVARLYAERLRGIYAPQIVVDGRHVDLSRRELRLLEILLGQIGRTVRKERLIDQLFGPDDDVAPNAVELYVSRLRKKLAASDIDIATLRGEGYVARLRPAGGA